MPSTDRGEHELKGIPRKAIGPWVPVNTGSGAAIWPPVQAALKGPSVLSKRYVRRAVLRNTNKGVMRSMRKVGLQVRSAAGSGY